MLARESFQSRIRCIGFGDGGLMHTSHLVNARRKTDRKRRVEECEGWEAESTEVGGRAESRGNDSRPRVYVHFHFDASPALHPKLLAIRRIRRPNTSNGWLNGTIVIHSTGMRGRRGRGEERQGKDYVRVGKDRWFRGRSKAATTSDNYLPRRLNSVLINSGVSFSAMLPYLISEYGLLSVCTIILNAKKNGEKYEYVCKTFMSRGVNFPDDKLRSRCLYLL